MTMESLPSILFQVGAADMGDLEFIQEKVIAGDYFQVSGDIDAITNTIEFVPATGKTAFLIEAKIIPNNASTNNKITAAPKIDGTIKDEAVIFRAQNQQFGATNLGGSGYGQLKTTQIQSVDWLISDGVI